MQIELWLAFVLASAVVLVIPGPTILTVMSYSLAHGRAVSVPLVAAVALGDCTSLALSLLGLGALLAASAFWFGVVKLAGGLYLLWLGIGLLRSGISAAAAAPAPVPASRWRLFANTYLVTALNPIIGYEKSTELAAEALQTGKGIIELIRERKMLTEKQIKDVLDPRTMTGQATTRRATRSKSRK